MKILICVQESKSSITLYVCTSTDADFHTDPKWCQIENQKKFAVTENTTFVVTNDLHRCELTLDVASCLCRLWSEGLKTKEEGAAQIGSCLVLILGFQAGAEVAKIAFYSANCGFCSLLEEVVHSPIYLEPSNI